MSEIRTTKKQDHPCCICGQPDNAMDRLHALETALAALPLVECPDVPNTYITVNGKLVNLRERIEGLLTLRQRIGR